MPRTIVVALSGMLVAGCTDTTDATVAPTMAPCVLAQFGEQMCLQVADDGEPPRLLDRSGLIYLDWGWGMTVDIEYADPRDDEGIACVPLGSNDCHRIVSQRVVQRMPAGTRFTVDFPDAGADRSWLTAEGAGLRLATTRLEATAAAAAQALDIDAMAVAYQLELELIEVGIPSRLRLIAATAR